MIVTYLFYLILLIITALFFVDMVHHMYIDNKVIDFITSTVSSIFFLLMFLIVLTMVTITTSDGRTVVKKSNITTM